MEELESIDRVLTLARDAPAMKDRIFDFHARLDVLAVRATEEKNTAMILAIAKIRVKHSMTYSYVKSLQRKKAWYDIKVPVPSLPAPTSESVTLQDSVGPSSCTDSGEP